MEHVELVDRVYQKIKQMIFDREIEAWPKTGSGKTLCSIRD